MISLASFSDVIPKQGVKGAQQNSIAFVVGSQAVTKQLRQENGHSCATRAHSMCFARRVAPAAVHAS